MWFKVSRAPRDLHRLTRASPTRRSSDLRLLGLGQFPLERGKAVRGGGLGVGRSLGDILGVGHRGLVVFDHCSFSSLFGTGPLPHPASPRRSEEHTSELQSLMRISYAVFCLKKKTHTPNTSTLAPA